MSNRHNQIRQSLLAILPGMIITLLGLTLWISSATLLYQIALPIMGLGLLLVLATIISHRHINRRMKAIILFCVLALIGSLWWLLFY